MSFWDIFTTKKTEKPEKKGSFWNSFSEPQSVTPTVVPPQPPIVPPVNNIGINVNPQYTNTGIPQMAIGKQLPFDATPLGIVKNTITGLPEAVKDVAKEITTSIARVPYSAGEALGRAVTGNYNPVSATQVPGTNKFLNPIESYQSQASREVSTGTSPLKATGKAVFNIAMDEPLGLTFKPLFSVGALGAKHVAKLSKEAKALYNSLSPAERQAGKIKIPFTRNELDQLRTH